MGKHEGEKPSHKPIRPIKPTPNGSRPDDDKGGKHEKGK